MAKKRKHPPIPIQWSRAFSEAQWIAFTTPNITNEGEARTRAKPLTETLETAKLRDGSEEDGELV